MSPTVTADKFSVAPHQLEESGPTSAIEHYTSQVPSSVYMSLAMASIGLSAFFKLTGRRDNANFVGHWAPTFLLLGLFNKLAKDRL